MAKWTQDDAVNELTALIEQIEEVQKTFIQSPVHVRWKKVGGHGSLTHWSLNHRSSPCSKAAIASTSVPGLSSSNTRTPS